MKWLFLDAKRRLSFAARHPGYAMRSALRQITLADERFLARVTDRSAPEIYRFFGEPSSHARFLDHLRASQAELAKAPFVSAEPYAKKVLIQYVVARAVQPDLIVETGVANGISTSYLLLALELNKKGRLHSIEIGDTSYLPRGRQPGWIVPDWLSERWTCTVGDARQVLSPFLQQLGSVDVFIHDSLHTYEQMLFELLTAYPHVRSGGLLLCNDASWNNAFSDFQAQAGTSAGAIVRGVGVARK